MIHVTQERMVFGNRNVQDFFSTINKIVLEMKELDDLVNVAIITETKKNRHGSENSKTVS